MKQSNRGYVNFHTFINRCTHWLEYAIAAVMLPAILISFYDIIMYVCSMVVNVFEGKQASADFDILFALALQLVIAVEFVIMLVNKSPISIIEVLTLAFAKKILVGNSTSMVELFFGVFAVLLLISARIAYNYFEGNRNNPNVFRAVAKVSDVNRSMGVNLPVDKDITLETLVINQMRVINIIPERGAEIFFQDAILRIHTMKGTRVERVEIIPCLNKPEVSHMDG